MKKILDFIKLRKLDNAEYEESCGVLNSLIMKKMALEAASCDNCDWGCDDGCNCDYQCDDGNDCDCVW